MTSLRLSASFSLSLGVTVAMFWFLGVLISAPPDTGTWVRTIRGVDVRFVPEHEPIRPPIIRPPIVKPKPIPDTSIQVIGRKDVGPRLDHETLIPETGGFVPGDGIGPRGDKDELPQASGSDRGPVPSVRLEPDYPETAKLRGITGWVTFRFTVTRDGSVKDVEIVDAQPKRVWDAATLRAVSSWKYQPAMKDGAPVEQTGLMVTYHFEL